MSTQPSYWSVDGAIDSLVAALKLRPNLAGIQVEDDWPGQTQQDEAIWIGDAISTDEVAGMKTGPINNTEDYTLYVWVDVFVGGGTAKQARDRVTVLAGEVMREVAEKKRLAVSENKIVMARVAGWQKKSYVMREGRGCSARISIRITGRR